MDPATAPPPFDSNDPITVAFSLGLGPWLTPLRGKVPYLDAWQELPPITEAQAREWVEAGFNLGLRTGRRSGILAVDVDRAKGATWRAPFPRASTLTPTGGEHYYCRAPDPCPGNTASTIAPHVDTRGEGGQVVFPGSRHPSGGRYRFAAAVPAIYPLPAGLLTAETFHVPALAPPPRRGYADTALAREVYQVSGAAPGTRNDTLNRAAFNLGTLVAGGELDSFTVTEALTAAAMQAGLPAKEIQTTLRSGLNGGAKHPRHAPPPGARPAPAAVAPRPSGAIFVPGSHTTPDGEYVEVGCRRFTQTVLEAMPEEALYRRGGVVGEIDGRSFAAVDTERMRDVIDGHLKLVVGKVQDDTPSLIFRPCSRDLAGLVRGSAAVASSPLRELRFLSPHPVYVGRDFDLAREGWNPDSGTYLTAPVPEPITDLATAKAVLEDLVVDFPFASPADRANYFGLMLTPILRPAIKEPVPMHLIGSPVERSGKTKLAEVVLGCTVTGEPIAALQLGDREEEREKRITSLLLSGASVIHLDNLAEHLDSAALASLLTSANYQGRILGSSRMASIANSLTVVGTGNNVHATGEITKRIVPVLLQPDTESPETRSDYRHADLRGFVEENRPRVLGALLGLVEGWKRAGRPLGSVGFGGFERWASVMGGIMATAGYSEWLGNLPAWRGQADDFGGELVAFATTWLARHGSEWVRGAALYELAVEMGLFGWLERAKTERGKKTSFGMRVLSRVTGRVVLPGLRVESDGLGEVRVLRLAKVPQGTARYGER